LLLAYRGGNSNNSANVGAAYLNLNNTAGNANWNIGAAHSYQALMGNECSLHSSALAGNQRAESICQ